MLKTISFNCALCIVLCTYIIYKIYLYKIITVTVADIKRFIHVNCITCTGFVFYCLFVFIKLLTFSSQEKRNTGSKHFQYIPFKTTLPGKQNLKKRTHEGYYFCLLHFYLHAKIILHITKSQWLFDWPLTLTYMLF